MIINFIKREVTAVSQFQQFYFHMICQKITSQRPHKQVWYQLHSLTGSTVCQKNYRLKKKIPNL